MSTLAPPWNLFPSSKHRNNPCSLLTDPARHWQRRGRSCRITRRTRSYGNARHPWHPRWPWPSWTHARREWDIFLFIYLMNFFVFCILLDMKWRLVDPIFRCGVPNFAHVICRSHHGYPSCRSHKEARKGQPWATNCRLKSVPSAREVPQVRCPYRLLQEWRTRWMCFLLLKLLIKKSVSYMRLKVNYPERGNNHWVFASR